jgi:hypothetical protein
MNDGLHRYEDKLPKYDEERKRFYIPYSGERLYTVNDVAKELHISFRIIYRWVEKGRLSPYVEKYKCEGVWHPVTLFKYKDFEKLIFDKKHKPWGKNELRLLIDARELYNMSWDEIGFVFCRTPDACRQAYGGVYGKR